jgi:hypothetical protein
MVFRTNFLFLWVVSNVGFFFAMMAMVQQAATNGILNGQMDSLVVYAIFIASIVVYKSFFALLYILGWKYDFLMDDRYREIANLDMQQHYDEVKKTRRNSSFADVRPTTTSLLPKRRETLVIDADSEEESRFGFEEAYIEEAEDKVRATFKTNNKKLTLDEI